MFPRRFAVVVACLALALAGRPAAAQRGLKDIPPPDTAAELAEMQVAEGYEVTLFAADPMISKPLQINFDPQGRLWVSSSRVYPQIRPGEVADDTVTILEDRDGDGRADAHTVFAAGLLMPTAVLPDDLGGAYVANSTEMLHLADTDGDGRADSRRVLLSGFGAEDTHHIIHTFRRGPDARVYFNQSIYIHSHVETPRGVRRLNGGGIWRFEPESLALDVFARGWVNTWGHVFDPWGRSLATDGAGGEGIAYAFPGAAYQAAVGVSRILHGMNPGSPKLCSLEILDGRHLPDDAQGVLVTNDFRANRVCRFRLTEQGSGFTSERLPDLIHSKRVTFRPIDVRMGPDGALYIADWYNPIIQHGEVDFRDERRDRTHGRIWRVTAKGRPLVPRVDFSKLANRELLGHVQSPEAHARDMARRVLFTRGGAAVKGDVDRWLAALDRQDVDFERLRLEGLRLKQGLDRGSAGDVDLALLRAVLVSTEPRSRAAACRVVCDWADRIEAPVELLAPAVDDPAPQVRLEAVRALAALGGTRAAELALHVVDHEMDTYLDYAARLTASELKDAWLPAVVAGTFADDGRLGRLVFAAEAVDAVDAVPRIAARLQEAGVTAADRAAALRCIARLGDSAAMRPAFEWAVSQETSPAGAAELLGRMLEAHQRRRTVPMGDVTAITGLVNAADEPLAIRAIEVTAAWRPPGGVEVLVAAATNPARPAAVRRAAITALAGLPDPAAHAALDGLATFSGEPGPFTAAAIVALVKRAPEDAAARAAAFLPRASAAKERPAVFQAFLGARDGGPKLAAALERSQAQLPADAVQAGQQAVNSSGRPVPELSAALAAAAARASGQPPPSTKSTHSLAGAELEAFVKLVRERGDPRRGAAIYARETLKCAACHRIGDQGGRVGPNLSAIGGSSPLDYIIDSLLEPAKNAKEGYTTLVVQTTDGRVVTGIPISRSDEQLLMRDANDREVSVRVADIDEESPGTSLMPAGLVDPLSREELADLVRYLSELGR